MKVTKRYDQHRRDLTIDLECEGCGHTTTRKDAYDDHYFWANVIPNKVCSECGESTNSLGIKTADVSTKYPDWQEV